MIMPLNRVTGKTTSTQSRSSCIRRQGEPSPRLRVNTSVQQSAVQKPAVTTDNSAIAAPFSFHNISSVHGNSRRRIMLCRHVLILVVRIAIARHATDLRRKMWLLLGALAVMRLRRCIATHRRCYVALAVNNFSTSWILLC